MRGQTVQGLPALGVVVSQPEGLPVLVELLGGFVGIAPHGGFFQSAVPARYLAVSPRMSWLGQAVLAPVLVADTAENVATSGGLVGPVAERRALVSQHGVHLVGPRGQQLGGMGGNSAKATWLVRSLAERHTALFGVHFGQIHGQAANGIDLEFLFGRAFSVFGQG